MASPAFEELQGWARQVTSPSPAGLRLGLKLGKDDLISDMAGRSRTCKQVGPSCAASSSGGEHWHRGGNQRWHRSGPTMGRV